VLLHVIIMKPGTFSGGSKYETTTDTMKYALLVHQLQEHFDNRDKAAVIAAGRAYVEALQSAGVFVGGAGLESPQAATENGKSMTDPMQKRKNFSPDSVSSTCRIWMPRWNGPRAIRSPPTPPSRYVPC